MRKANSLRKREANPRRSAKHFARHAGAVPRAFNIGDIVAVFGCRPQTGPFLEGWAYVGACCPVPHLYRVRFYGERVVRVRFVHPDWQSDVERSLALLIEFWRASEPAVEDFYTDAT
jgi:hypothetical protein